MTGSNQHSSPSRYYPAEPGTLPCTEHGDTPEMWVCGSCLARLEEQYATLEAELAEATKDEIAYFKEAEQLKEQYEYVSRERRECAIAYNLCAKERHDLQEQLEAAQTAMRKTHYRIHAASLAEKDRNWAAEPLLDFVEDSNPAKVEGPETYQEAVADSSPARSPHAEWLHAEAEKIRAHNQESKP